MIKEGSKLKYPASEKNTKQESVTGALTRILNEAMLNAVRKKDNVSYLEAILARQADEKIFGAEYVVGALTDLTLRGLINPDEKLQKVIEHHRKAYKKGGHPLLALLQTKDIATDLDLDLIRTAGAPYKSALLSRLITYKLYSAWNNQEIREDPNALVNRRYYHAITGRSSFTR